MHPKYRIVRGNGKDKEGKLPFRSLLATVDAIESTRGRRGDRASANKVTGGALFTLRA